MGYKFLLAKNFTQALKLLANGQKIETVEKTVSFHPRA